MSAYANRQRLQSARLFAEPDLRHADLGMAPAGPIPTADHNAADAAHALHALLDHLVDRVAAAVIARLEDQRDAGDEWLDSRQAADYLGLHRDTLRRLSAARAIPAEQDGRGCRLFFRRTVLDEWRRSGGSVRHLTAISDAA